MASTVDTARTPLRTTARALAGDMDALRTVFEQITAGGGPSQRAWPALAYTAGAQGIEAPDIVRHSRRRAAAHHLALSGRLEDVGQALDNAGVVWAPIKGMDLAYRPGAYPTPEARPTADLDVLVHQRSLESARDVLSAAGWTSLARGPQVERYLRDEGYAWQARGADGGLLELHFRLWGSVAGDAGDSMLDDAPPDPAVGGHRLVAEHAFLIAAIHAFLDPPPRGVIAWHDLLSLARAGATAPAIVAAARRFDLHLPVALAAKVAHRLWEHPTTAGVVDGLREHLAVPERLLLDRNQHPEATSLAGMVSVRYLARRRMRHSFRRLLMRRLWPHPGIVEAAGVSRSAYQLAIWGLRRPSATTSGD